MNMVRTAMLLAFMTALFMAIGYMLGGTGGMMIALLVAAGMNVFSYWNSDKMVLRMHHAVEVDARTAPEYYGIVKQLAERADLPMPKVYLINNDQPNAFATGRNPQNAAVAATTGLLNRLSYEEVAGVMAHELAHVKHHDTLTMTITATLAGAITMLANFAIFFRGGRDNPLGIIGMLLAMILAPLAAGMVQMAISRTREYSADRGGAEICGNPLWLASALQKITGGARQVVNEDAERNPATAHMFIINPLNGQRMDGLFTTHPATENRVAALQKMAAEQGIDGGSRPAPRRRDTARRREASHRPETTGPATSGPWGRNPGRKPPRGPWS